MMMADSFDRPVSSSLIDRAAQWVEVCVHHSEPHWEPYIDEASNMFGVDQDELRAHLLSRQADVMIRGLPPKTRRRIGP